MSSARGLPRGQEADEGKMSELRELRRRALELVETDNVDEAEVRRLLVAFETCVEGILDAANAVESSLLPFNYAERMDYIKKQPARYHARVQLHEIIIEFDKKYAVWRARRLR